MFIKESEKSLKYIDTNSNNIVKSLDNKLYEIKVNRGMFGTSYTFSENNAYDKGKLTKVGVFKELSDYVDDYYSEEGKEVRNEMDLPNRLGMLLVGDPGTGKTFTAGQIAKELCQKENAVAITTTEPTSLDLGLIVDMARGEDHNRLVIMIWDEFEKDYKKTGNSGLNKLLSFLDGVDSRDNVLVLATCNDFSVFPSTLLERRGRFEKVTEFKIKDKNILNNLVSSMIPTKYKEKLNITLLLDYFYKEENLTIDTIKSIVRDSLVNLLRKKVNIIPQEGNKVNLKEIKNKTPLDDYKKQKIKVGAILDLLDSYPYTGYIDINSIVTKT